MSVDFRCPYCERAGRLPEGFVRGRVKCPSCHNSLPVNLEPDEPHDEPETIAELVHEPAPEPTTPPEAPVPSRRWWGRAAIGSAAAVVVGILLLRPVAPPHAEAPPRAVETEAPPSPAPAAPELKSTIAAPSPPAVETTKGEPKEKAKEPALLDLPNPAVPAEASARIQDATVYLKVGDDPETTTGTGFVVLEKEGVVYIVTNHHVAASQHASRKSGGGGAAPWPSITAVFRSGDPQGREQSLPAQVVAYDRVENRDLALLSVTGATDAPRPIDLPARRDLAENAPLFVYGFPSEDAPTTDRRNPAVVVSAGRRAPVDGDEGHRAPLLRIEGAITPGNSGGPVTDEHGRLVGVAVASNADADLGSAVPAEEVVQMLEGRVGRFRIKLAGARRGRVDLDIRARLIDPFEKIQSVEVLNGRKPIPHDPSRTDWPELPDASRTRLARRGEEAEGNLHVAASPGQELTIQTCIKDASGRTRADRPFTFLVPMTPDAIITNGREKSARTQTDGGFSTLIDPRNLCSLTRRDAQTIIDVPPGVFGPGPDFATFPAPMALHEIEGDFDLSVDVDGALHPGLDPVKHKGRLLPNTYQGVGIILYQDRANYVRIERGAASQQPSPTPKNPRPKPTISTEVVVEVRGRGRTEPLFVQGVPEGAATLRIVRSHGVVRCMAGRDPYWFAIRQPSLRFPDQIQVGLIATNLSNQRLSARLLKTSLTISDDPMD